jgi:SPP1 family predicted phage head-tail adaptor
MLKAPDASLSVGRLRHQINIVQPGTATDSMGGTTPGGGTTLATVWAAIEMPNGRDALVAQSFNSMVTHVITTRWIPGVLAKQQVTWVDAESRTRVFQIMAVLNPDERNRVLRLFVVEINDSVQQS